MSSSDRDRVQPARSLVTPVRQPDAATAHPLATPVRDKMEAGFGHDFSAVRVHADHESAMQARQMGAQAFTVGQDVHFAAGRYQPRSERGQELVAHELAHVVQQAHGGATGDAEQRADAAAERIHEGKTVSTAALGGAPRSVQMKPDEPAGKQVEVTPAADPGSWSKTLNMFGPNSAVLRGGHRKAINALAAEIVTRAGLAAGARVTITILGHTDTSGGETYNERMGLKRADVVKAALEAALTRKKLGADRIAGISAESAGETSLAKDTADDVKQPLNRRVEITVKIEGPAPTTSTAPAISETTEEPAELRVSPGDKSHEELGPRRPPGENLWEKMNENQRKRDEFDKTLPRKNRNLTDVIVEGVTKGLEPVIKKLPKSLRGTARDAIRMGIEQGTEAGCDAAIDVSGVRGDGAEAMKTACKAALKTKPGGEKK